MTDTRTVAVVGAAGTLGHLIVEALLARPEKLTVRAVARDISSDASKSERLGSLRRRGAVLVVADLTTGAGLDAAVAGADVVISAVQGGPEVIIDGQGRLLEACRTAGVGRIVPSDYSMDLFRLEPGENMSSDPRRTFAAKVRESGVGHSFMLNGGFMEVVVSPFLQLIDEAAGTLSYWGEGDVPLDLTAMPDVAAFLAAAILDPDTLNRTIEVAGDRVDIPAMASAFQQATGTRLELVRLVSIEDGYAELARRQSAGADRRSLLPLMYALPMMSGRARLLNVENDRFPDVRPQSLQSFLMARVATTAGADA